MYQKRKKRQKGQKIAQFFKIESIKKGMPDFYTNEGLKKAGFTDEDIRNQG